MMVLLCLPSLVFCALLTLPGLIFRSPYQDAFFYFSMVLNEDPARWAVLALGGLCALISLAMPAVLRESKPPIRY